MRPDPQTFREQLRDATAEVLPGTTVAVRVPDAIGTGSTVFTAARLRLVIDGQVHSLVLHARAELLAQAFRQWMGRAATDQELSQMADEVAAELLNQLGGRFAGKRGDSGSAVELATPQPMAPGARVNFPADGIALAWQGGGQDSFLLLLPGTVP